MSKMINNLMKILFAVVFVVSMLSFAMVNGIVKAESVVDIYDGAEIRLDDPVGIRFLGFADDDLFKDTETHELKDNVTVGMYIVPESFTDENVTELTSSTQGVIAVSSDDENFLWMSESRRSGFQQYNVVLYNIPAESYGEKVLACAFVTENGIETRSATVIRSISQVANASLAEEALSPGSYTEGEIAILESYRTATTALSDVSVKVVDGEATWNSVSNAVGYLVSTDSDMFSTTETSFSLTDETEISVIAYGNGVDYACSNVASKGVHTLETTQLATFNDASYTNDLIAGNPNVTGYWPVNGFLTYQKDSQGIRYATPEYESSEEGAEGGSVLMSVPITSYVASGCRHAAFTVELQKGLDLTTYTGIKVRIKVISDNVFETLGIGNRYLFLGGPDNVNQGYKLNSTTGIAVTPAPLGEWVEWFIPASTLDTYYDAGDTEITFIVWGTNGVSVNANNQIVYSNLVLIDDISYYTQLSAPTNLSESGLVVSWDSVDNATGYVVKIGNNEYPVVGTSLDISSYVSGDTTVYVKACDSGDYIDSEYASVAIIYLAAGEIATFNSAAYEGMIATLPAGQQGKPSDSPQRVTGVTYLSEEDCAGSNGGALDIRMGNSSAERQMNFIVKFAEGLDFTDYDGITVRFKLYNTAYFSNVENPVYNFKVINANGSVYTTSRSSEENETHKAFVKIINAGEWTEVTFTKETIEKCYYNDDNTKLTFQINMASSWSWNAAGGGVGIYLDDISYYND